MQGPRFGGAFCYSGMVASTKMTTRVQTNLFPGDPAAVAVEIDGRALEILEAFAEASKDEVNEEVELEKVTAIRALAYVLGKNFKAAEKAIKEDDTFSISFKVTWDRSSLPTEVKAVAKCSTTYSSDIELRCEQ